MGNFSWSGRSFEGSPAARRCLDSLEASVAQGQQQLRERNTRQMTVMFFRPLAAARQELRVLEVRRRLSALVLFHLHGGSCRT